MRQSQMCFFLVFIEYFQIWEGHSFQQCNDRRLFPGHRWDWTITNREDRDLSGGRLETAGFLNLRTGIEVSEQLSLSCQDLHPHPLNHRTERRSRGLKWKQAVQSCGVLFLNDEHSRLPKVSAIPGGEDSHLFHHFRLRLLSKSKARDIFLFVQRRWCIPMRRWFRIWRIRILIVSVMLRNRKREGSDKAPFSKTIFLRIWKLDLLHDCFHHSPTIGTIVDESVRQSAGFSQETGLELCGMKKREERKPMSLTWSRIRFLPKTRMPESESAP